jgi:hypothetical protein
VAMLHYVTFVEPFGVEPFGVLPTEAVSFDDAKFVSNYTNKVFQSKKKDHVLCFGQHLFDARSLYKKNNEVQFKELHMKC